MTDVPKRSRSEPHREDRHPLPAWRRRISRLLEGEWGNTVRLGAQTCLYLLLMACIYFVAVKTTRRGWHEKEVRAKSGSIAKQRGTKDAVAGKGAVAERPGGRPWQAGDAAAARTFARLATVSGQNAWLLQARGALAAGREDGIRGGCALAAATGADAARVEGTLGAFELRHGRPAAAKRHFRRVAEADPALDGAHYNWALCAIGERNHAEAIRVLARHAARRPGDAASLQLLVRLLEQAGRRDEAYRVAAGHAAQSTAAAPLALEAAALALQTGNDGEALGHIRTALETCPLRAVVLVWQGRAFREVRQTDEGMELGAEIADRARAVLLSPSGLPLEPRSLF